MTESPKLSLASLLMSTWIFISCILIAWVIAMILLLVVKLGSVKEEQELVNPEIINSLVAQSTKCFEL